MRISDWSSDVCSSDLDSADRFKVSGRGELHLSILVENMRREGYELAISRPEVILKEVEGEIREPWETLTIDVEEEHQGSVMEKLGERRGSLREIMADGNGRVRPDYLIPTRGLIGFRSESMTLTSGSGLIYHTFDHYGPRVAGSIGTRQNGVMISNGPGQAVPYALSHLQAHGRRFVEAHRDLN